MNNYKSMSNIQLKVNQIIEDSNNKKLELLALDDKFRKGEKILEEKIITEFIKLEGMRKTVNHFKALGTTTGAGDVITSNYLKSLINDTSGKISKVLLRMAKDIIEVKRTHRKMSRLTLDDDMFNL